MATTRLTYEDSVRRLQKDYLDPGTVPPMPGRMPRYDDDAPLGVSFFRTFVGDGNDLSNLYLPRTFFGRSEINRARFCNTDFSQSSMCWNDFIDVDFTDAVLIGCDLRASIFKRVRFVGANLCCADLRRASFDDCHFEGAMLHSATMTGFQAGAMGLSQQQRSEINLVLMEGPSPGGG